MLGDLGRILNNPLVFRIQEAIFNNYSNVRHAFEDYLSPNDKDILDIGCSTGACAGRIIDMKSNRYTGIDIEPSYVALARRLYPDGQFLAQDARDLPFQDGSFDIVLFNCVWHHMDDGLLRACLAEVRRVLRSTGVILVCEPVFRRDWPISAFLLERDRGKFIRTREGYRSFLDQFVIVDEMTFRLSMHEVCGFVARRCP